MTSFLVDNMAPLMFAALVVFLLIGYPVAFAHGAIGLLFGLIGIELGLLKQDCLIQRNETSVRFYPQTVT